MPVVQREPGVPAPLGSRVIVEQLPAETQIGSIVLPAGAVEAPLAGRVVAISASVATNHANMLKLGDIVLFPKFGGCVITWNSKTLLILDSADLLAVDLESRKTA